MDHQFFLSRLQNVYFVVNGKILDRTASIILKNLTVKMNQAICADASNEIAMPMSVDPDQVITDINEKKVCTKCELKVKFTPSSIYLSDIELDERSSGVICSKSKGIIRYYLQTEKGEKRIQTVAVEETDTLEKYAKNFYCDNEKLNKLADKSNEAVQRVIRDHINKKGTECTFSDFKDIAVKYSNASELAQLSVLNQQFVRTKPTKTTLDAAKVVSNGLNKKIKEDYHFVVVPGNQVISLDDLYDYEYNRRAIRYAEAVKQSGFEGLAKKYYDSNKDIEDDSFLGLTQRLQNESYADYVERSQSTTQRRGLRSRIKDATKSAKEKLHLGSQRATPISSSSPGSRSVRACGPQACIPLDAVVAVVPGSGPNAIQRAWGSIKDTFGRLFKVDSNLSALESETEPLNIQSGGDHPYYDEWVNRDRSQSGDKIEHNFDLDSDFTIEE